MLRRLPASHPQRERIGQDLRIAYAGNQGERSLEFHLNFTRDDYLIFHDLRLPWINGYHFQIDLLLVSPFCIFILEVKHIAGKLYFDDTAQQLIRTNEDKEEVFPYPITQIHRHQHQLQDFLNRHAVPAIPIIPLVVSSKSSSLLQASSNAAHIFDSVVHSASLPFKINSLKNRFRTQILSQHQLDELSSLLLKNHTPLMTNELARYHLQEKQLIKGILCIRCTTPSMRREWGYWKCGRCGFQSIHAHIQSLIDYLLLIDHEITNKRFRDFTLLNSRSVTSKLLNVLPLKHHGTYKNRTYLLDFEKLSQLLDHDE